MPFDPFQILTCFGPSLAFCKSFLDDPDDPDAVKEYGSSSEDPDAKNATFRGSELCLFPLFLGVVVTSRTSIYRLAFHYIAFMFKPIIYGFGFSILIEINFTCWELNSEHFKSNNVD